MEDCGKVSVIIPVYNCEKYLPRCLESVLHQTYKNIEVILVNDGSTDGTPRICDEYAKQFPVIKVFHQENAGPGLARNTALDAMTGDYLTYVDSDDYVSEEYVETMLELLKEYDADIAEVGLVCLQQIRDVFDNSDGIIRCFDGADILIQDYFSKNGQIRNCIAGRMYDIKKFGEIRFSEKSIGEDSEYSLKMLSNCGRLVKYNKCLYVCRAYQETSTRTALNHKNFDIVEVLFRDAVLAEKWGIELFDWNYVFQKFIDTCYGLLYRVVSARMEKEFIPELENMVLVFKNIRELARRQGIELSNQLVEDIEHIDIWAKRYRKENWIQLFIIKRIKSWISKIVACYKIKISYEYRFEDK